MHHTRLSEKEDQRFREGTPQSLEHNSKCRSDRELFPQKNQKKYILPTKTCTTVTHTTIFKSLGI